MRAKPFSRPTVIAAAEFLEGHKQAQFNQLVTRLGLENEISAHASISMAKKCDMLARIVVQRPDEVLDALDGTMTLAEAVVREAVRLIKPGSTSGGPPTLDRRGAPAGYVVTFECRGIDPLLRAALPDEIELPAMDDEVHQLLKSFQFTTPLGHLDHSIEAHTRGDWAACNSQLRTFLESLFDHLAATAAPQEVTQRHTLVCCTDPKGGRIRPQPRSRSGDANGDRASKLQHTVERIDADLHLDRPVPACCTDLACGALERADVGSLPLI